MLSVFKTVYKKLLKDLPIYLIKAYQYLLRPWLGRQCRFYPTCSDYALQTLKQSCKPIYKIYGQIIWRLLRCQPYSKGGFDYPSCEYLNKQNSSKNYFTLKVCVKTCACDADFNFENKSKK